MFHNFLLAVNWMQDRLQNYEKKYTNETMEVGCPIIILIRDNTYSRARSSLTLLSTSIILDPTRSCITIPDVTIGVIPSSITVPRFEARITRIQ
jgi:hypothetical protein